jgi:hypothetical protein
VTESSAASDSEVSDIFSNLSEPFGSMFCTISALLSSKAIALSIGCFAVAACNNKQAAPVVDREAKPAVIETSPTAKVNPSPASNSALATLGARLQNEAANRPSNTVTAEQVWTALAAQAFKVDGAKQYLAATARAQYCNGGKLPTGVAIVVCEYASPKAAADGKAFVEKQFAVAAGRTIHIRQATTLTLVSPSGPAEETDRVAKIFLAL